MQEKVLKLHLKALNSMVKLDNNQQAFFALVRAGLWEQNVQLSQPEEISFKEVYRLAEEQSVMGLVAAGIEHVQDVKVPQKIALSFVGVALQLEQRNIFMNERVASIIQLLQKHNINAILLKGQGVAQCYEKPLWRSAGDIDFLLSEKDYENSKAILFPQASSVESEYTSEKHIGMNISGVEVELHGTFHTRLSARIDSFIDTVQKETTEGNEYRIWNIDETGVRLPSPNNDIIFLFTHIIKHFYIEGIGIRQICDMSRFLWKYHRILNHELLENRLRTMGLMTEWKAFAAFAVDYLGMPVDAVPLYDASKRWKGKADGICAFVMETGNFGHNRATQYSNNYAASKLRSGMRKIKDFGNHARLFPADSIKFFFHFMREGIGNVTRGE